MAVGTLSYPFAVIDFEASSLSDERSYPIEVGVAIVTAEGEPIRTWSSLIKPTPEWIDRGRWSARSEAVHGIGMADLESGQTPRSVAEELNRLAAYTTRSFCDGGEYDAHWLRRLFEAARLRPAFELADIADLIGSDPQAQHRFADALAKTEAPHRAGADAERLCAAIQAASGQADL